MSESIPPTPPLPVQAGSLRQLHEFASGGYLYALTDGCNAPEYAAQLQRLPRDRAVPLLCDGDAQLQGSAIPWLAKVDAAMLQFIVESLWREPWGVFAFSKSNLDALRLHFRRFLVVQLPDGEQWFFRFYDPRILPLYLPNCNGWELRKFFGPVRGFGIPVSETGALNIVQEAPNAANAGSPLRATDPQVSLVWKIRSEQARALDPRFR